MLLARAANRCLTNKTASRRSFSFSFVGPRNLNDILKTEMLTDKNATEVSEIWFSYHEPREKVHGLIMKGTEGKDVISRAKQCPYFIQPVFREDGFFNLVSQFQEPNHFLMAFLEDYKMDPGAAQPLLTFSVFDDYSDQLDLTLVRCDVVNKGIEDDEGLKIVQSMLDSYRKEEDFDRTVKIFNQEPGTFDFDDFISRQNQKWKNPPAVSD